MGNDNNPDSAIAIMAQVALNCGDVITAFNLMTQDTSSYKLRNKKLPVPEAVEILAQSPKYKEILPSALDIV